MSKGPEGEAIRLAKQRTEILNNHSADSAIKVGIIEGGIIGVAMCFSRDASIAFAVGITIGNAIHLILSAAKLRRISTQLNSHSDRQHMETYRRPTIVNKK